MRVTLTIYLMVYSDNWYVTLYHLNANLQWRSLFLKTTFFFLLRSFKIFFLHHFEKQFFFSFQDIWHILHKQIHCVRTLLCNIDNNGKQHNKKYFNLKKKKNCQPGVFWAEFFGVLLYETTSKFIISEKFQTYAINKTKIQRK